MLLLEKSVQPEREKHQFLPTLQVPNDVFENCASERYLKPENLDSFRLEFGS